jgi:hypothetical protein
MGILYKLNFSSGKSYIGQTMRNMDIRFGQHRRSAINGGSMLAVHCAWRKHGEPDIEILMSDIENQDDMHQAEIESIEKYGTISPGGYNVGHGGETAPSKNVIVAEKIRKKATGRKYNNSAERSLTMKKVWEGAEYRAKISASLKKNWTPERREEARQRILAVWKKRKEDGWKMPESTKKKISEKAITPDTREKMSRAKKGKPGRSQSASEKSLASKRMKEFWSNPENTARRSLKIREALAIKKSNLQSNTNKE